jgi:hypothetical protein
LVTVLPRHRDDQIHAIEHDLGSADADTVDPLLDDLPCLIKGLAGRWPAVDGPGSEGYPSTALQVDAQLRAGLPTTGEEDQRVQQDDDPSEDRQITPGAKAPSRWCHGGWFSSFDNAALRTAAGA